MPLIAPDVSTYQAPLTRAFNRRVLIMRVTFGAHMVDNHFLANANMAAKMYADGDIDGVILYTVYLSSQTPQAQYAATWKAIGPKVPDWLIGIMIDVESWSGQSYAIRGDHSKQINTLYGLHAHRMGSWSSCIAYGNRSDLASIYPGRDKRCRVIVAGYGSQLTYSKVSGAIGQQYTDGQPKWGVPKIGGKALPTSTPPFGRCDHNVFPGHANGKTLRALLRPVPAKHATPAPAKAAPKPKPSPVKRYYRAAALPIVSPDGSHAAWLTNDGHLDIRSQGHHVRYL